MKIPNKGDFCYYDKTLYLVLETYEFYCTLLKLKTGETYPEYYYNLFNTHSWKEL